MPTRFSRAGLTLGAIGIACAVAAPASADDIRSAQALLEGGLFFSQTEADAVYARLDADRSPAKGPAPKTMSFWESGGAGFGQSERAGRMGSGGGVTQMRAGADREVRAGLIVGAVASVGFGGIGSGELGAQVIAKHADFYARNDRGAMFFKALGGVSHLSFNDVTRGECRTDASAFAARLGGQFGGTARIAGFTFTPTVSLTASGSAVGAFNETGGENAASFDARRAGSATGVVRLAGSRDIRLDATRKLKLEAFVAADEILAFQASALRARIAGERLKAASFGAPNGRGVVGGLGVGATLAEGVMVNLNYDYSTRDGVSTRTGRARLGVSF